jgi:hypothetical protein
LEVSLPGLVIDGFLAPLIGPWDWRIPAFPRPLAAFPVGLWRRPGGELKSFLKNATQAGKSLLRISALCLRFWPSQGFGVGCGKPIELLL